MAQPNWERIEIGERGEGVEKGRKKEREKEKEHTDPSERRSVSQCGVRKRERLQGESSH